MRTWLTLALLLCGAARARAGVPGSFTVQGVLRDSSGALQSMMVQVGVSLYDAPTMGNVLASYPTQPVMAQDGLFTVSITDAGLPYKLVSPAAVWLELAVAGSVFPRQQVTSDFFALLCGVAEVAVSMPGVTDTNGTVVIGTPATPGGLTVHVGTNQNLTIGSTGSGAGDSVGLSATADNGSAALLSLTTTTEVVSGNPVTLYVRTTNTSGQHAAVRLANAFNGGFEIATDAGVGSNAHNFFLYDVLAGVARLFVDAAGNVGIGTTAPQATLDVNGTVRLKAYDPAAMPINCDLAHDGVIALTTSHKLCVCVASTPSPPAWKLASDGTTTCS
jgi:hypothetical protein